MRNLREAFKFSRNLQVLYAVSSEGLFKLSKAEQEVQTS